MAAAGIAAALCGAESRKKEMGLYRGIGRHFFRRDMDRHASCDTLFLLSDVTLQHAAQYTGCAIAACAHAGRIGRRRARAVLTESRNVFCCAGRLSAFVFRATGTGNAAFTRGGVGRRSALAFGAVRLLCGTCIVLCPCGTAAEKGETARLSLAARDSSGFFLSAMSGTTADGDTLHGCRTRRWRFASHAGWRGVSH